MPKSSSSSPSPPPTPFRRQTKSCARKCERGCCAIATYIPLAFVYSVTTWAVYVEASIGLRSPSTGNSASWTFKPTSLLGVILYLLLNTCYSVAVFTDPGSPVRKADARADYSSLPTVEPTPDARNIQSVTVSSTGAPRYCKKCQTPKPDRTHHCSTCRRCVLKMDHHCPWLATCLGLHNYKAFILFLIYSCLFCWVCFLSTALWVWTEIFEQNQYLEESAPVNVVLLAVVSAIFGLVLTGFTGWHIYLCCKGQTTIECLEKTRYLGVVRRQVERQRHNQTTHHRQSSSQGFAEALQRAGEQIIEFHANAVPGATRVEEGEERTSPALEPHPGTRFVPTGERGSDRGTPAEQALRRTYSSIEQQRERDRYEEYLDDKESQKLPNAFDLGWKRNLLHLFGPKPLLWFLPVCNTTGDGWQWEISPKWKQATEEVARRRQESATHAANHPNDTHLRGGDRVSYESADDLENGNAGSAVNMHTLKRPGHLWGKARQRRDFDQTGDGDMDQYEVSSDEELEAPWRSR